MSDVVYSPARTYGRGFLLALYSSPLSVKPSAEVVDRLHESGLWTKRLCLRRTRRPTRGAWLRPYRHCRGSRACRRQLAKSPVLLARENGAFILVSVSINPPLFNIRSAGDTPAKNRPRQLVDVQRAPPSCVFGCLNVRSIGGKFDDIMELQRDRAIDVFCMVETWHDPESVAIRRLRSSGYSVVDRPRPRDSTDTLSVNHGGVAVVVKPGVRLYPVALALGRCPTTFEVIAARVTVGPNSYVVVVIYRPGSDDVTSTFFDELSNLLDRVVTTNDALFIVGDLNVHLERSADVHAQRLRDLLGYYDLDVRNTESTHNLGGQLDVVVSRRDEPCTPVTTYDAGLSDHKLLTWSVDGGRATTPATTVDFRPWRTVSIDDLRAALAASPLGNPDQ